MKCESSIKVTNNNYVCEVLWSVCQQRLFFYFIAFGVNYRYVTQRSLVSTKLLVEQLVNDDYCSSAACQTYVIAIVTPNHQFSLHNLAQQSIHRQLVCAERANSYIAHALCKISCLPNKTTTSAVIQHYTTTTAIELLYNPVGVRLSYVQFAPPGII